MFGDKYGIEYYFKASYDKANRTSINGERGVGMMNTFADFIEMKRQISGLKILTDFHSVTEINAVGMNNHIVDVIQIPLFLCRQTDLIKTACATGLIVNIKKDSSSTLGCQRHSK